MPHGRGVVIVVNQTHGKHRPFSTYSKLVIDIKEINRTPGDRWMIHGPRDYIPPIEVNVELKR